MKTTDIKKQATDLVIDNVVSFGGAHKIEVSPDEPADVFDYFDELTGRRIKSGEEYAIIAFGRLVASIREACRLSQVQMAKRLGLTQQRVSVLESGTGKKGPAFAQLFRIADACDMVVDITLRHKTGGSLDGEDRCNIRVLGR